MENLTDLQKKAVESLRSKRTLNTRNPQALQFSDDEIAEEMQLLQAGEEELQKRKEANARSEEERQQRISAENDQEHTERLDKQYRNKALGLGQKYDPKMLEYASTIFPSLKEMGLSSGPISPEVAVERSPAVEDMQEIPQQKKKATSISPSAAVSRPQEISEQQPQETSSDIDEMIKRARQEEDEASTAAQFAKLRDAIIGVGAGKVIQTDTSVYDERKKKATRPIENLTLKQQLESNKAKNDPNSQISKLMRDSLKSLGLDTGSMDKVSYAQLEKLYPSLANAIMSKSIADAKRIDAAESRAVRNQQQAERSYEKTRSIVNNKITKLTEGKSSPFTGYEQAKQTTQLLDNAIESWDNDDKEAKIKKQAAFMQYAKIAQGDDSVVRSSDMQVLAGSLNYTSPSSLLNKFISRAEGSPFTKDELLEMKKVVDTIRKVKKRQLQQRIDPIKLDAERGGYDLDQSVSPDIIDEIYSPEPPTLADRKKRLEELKKKQGK